MREEEKTQAGKEDEAETKETFDEEWMDGCVSRIVLWVA